MQRWEQARLGERWGTIDVDGGEECDWLYWQYCVRVVDARAKLKFVTVRIELPMPEGEPWLYVEGDPLIEGAPLTALSWRNAGAQYDAQRHIQILTQYRATILADEAVGLRQLRAAAGVAGQKRNQVECSVV
jgi:hypothetical protein